MQCEQLILFNKGTENISKVKCILSNEGFLIPENRGTGMAGREKDGGIEILLLKKSIRVIPGTVFPSFVGILPFETHKNITRNLCHAEPRT